MIKKLIIIFSIVLLIGSVLFGIGYFMSKYDVSNIEDNTYANQSNAIELTEFDNIKVEVTAADIEIQEGDNYTISYNLSDQEKIEKVEVIDGTFYFITSTDVKKNNLKNFGDLKINITIPKDKDLLDLNLSNVDGNITFDNKIINNAILESVAGDIVLTNVIADFVSCDLVNGEISITKSKITDVVIGGVSATINLDGSFKNASIDTVSGKCNLNSNEIDNINIDTVSGDIYTTTPPTNITAESLKKVTYNGEKKGSEFSVSKGKGKLNLYSTSGKISINTEN